MSDPHRRFGAWLLAGAPGEPPRDAALHASVCAECMAGVAALDALAAVDPGRALLPPSIRAPQRGTAVLRTPALAAGAVLIIALGIAAGVGSAISRGDKAEGAVLEATGTPAATTQPTSRPTPSAASSRPAS